MRAEKGRYNMGLFDLFSSVQSNNEELLKLAERHAPFIRRTLAQPKRRIIAEAKMLAPQWLKISHDCEKLINNTMNPDVFFSRFELLESVCACLVLIQPYVKFTGTQPRKAFKTLQEIRPMAAKAFIERSYEKMIQQADGLKTEKGRTNKIEKYFSSMNPYLNRLDDDSLHYLNELKSKHC